MLIYIILIVIVILIAGIIIAGTLRRRRQIPPHKAAGNAGEDAAASVIKRILRKGDRCFRNVRIEYEGRESELDFLIVNKNGVFIIEVKNYSGKLRGTENDRNWKKTKTSQSGKNYVNTVENPIPQIKREEYLLGNFLRAERIRVWVNGYVYFVRGNRPFKNRYLLNSGNEIDIAIHEERDRTLSDKTITRIITALDL